MLCSPADGTGYSRRTDTTHESNLNVRHAALITNFLIYIACLRTLCMTHEMYPTNTTLMYSESYTITIATRGTKTNLILPIVNTTSRNSYRNSFSLPTFSLSEGFSSLIKRVSLILHCKSDFPVARISKWSHLMLWPVEIIWSAKAEA